MPRRKLAFCLAVAALVAASALDRPHADLRIAATGAARSEVKAALDLSAIGLPVLLTWTAQQLR